MTALRDAAAFCATVAFVAALWLWLDVLAAMS